MNRIPLWFIILLFGGVLLIGLISLPFTLFTSWDNVFADGGIADQFLNVFAYGLMIFLLILPAGLGGLALVWQPGREAAHDGDHARNGHRVGRPQQRTPYRVWKAACGLALIYFAVLLARETFSSAPAFPTSRTAATGQPDAQ